MPLKSLSSNGNVCMCMSSGVQTVDPKFSLRPTCAWQVLEGMDFVESLNEAPVSQGQFLEGAFKFSVR
jgi:hypothetical protein